MPLNAEFLAKIYKDMSSTISEDKDKTSDLATRIQELSKDPEIRDFFNKIIVKYTLLEIESSMKKDSTEDFAKNFMSSLELANPFIHKTILMLLLAAFNLGYEARRAEEEASLLEKMAG